ncbi:MAG: putative RND superfamily exporter protein [Oleiphilaceae bacterium]|jgi:predicted RND superfamily exporter protein
MELFMINRWFFNIVHFRWVVILASVLLAIAAGWGGQYLEMKSDYREFFAEDDPQRAAFNRLQDTYAQSDTVFFVIAPNDGVVFQRDVLSMVESLTDAAWQLPHSLRVDSLTNFQHTTADEEGLVVENLVEDATRLTDTEIAAIKGVALKESLIAGKLITGPANVTGVAVTINLPGESNDEFGEVARAARVIADEYRVLYPEIDIYLSGMIMGNNTTTELIEQDAALLVPLMGLIIVFTLLLLLRSVRATLAAVTVIVMTLVSTMGLMGWLGFSITGPSSSAPIIIVTIAVADCVHILVSYFFLSREGLSKTPAILKSMKINFGPIFLTSVTTAIGFLSMNYSDSPPFQVLGTVSAIGVMVAFLLSITLLPALMAAMLPVKKAEVVKDNGGVLKPLADRVIKHPLSFFWGVVAISTLLFTAIQKNEVNDEFVKFFGTNQEFRQAVDFSNEHLVGVSTIEYALVSPNEGGINSPEFLQQLDQFSEWLLTQPEVKQVTSLSDTMKRLNRDMHAGDEAWYKIPESTELAAQYLLLYEMSLPFGLDMTNQIDFDKLETRVTASLEELNTNKMLALEARISLWLETQLPEIEFYDSSGTVMFAHLSVNNSYSSLISTGIALILISIILTFALKSLKMGLVSLLVNIAPAALAFGVWGLLVGQIGLSISVAIGMTLGIVVDNTVHFLSKYLNARREQGLSTEAAIRYAFSHVGTALLVCNAVLISGFLVLAQSNFMLNSDMGYFTALTFALALAVDFLFLPPFLMFIEKKRGLPRAQELDHSLEATGIKPRA